ncbi:hypothetical protein DUI87_34146 [Hirundo rustica rustica]|uniref:ribonuclease H n=1 Tax=Hirundo rustica rustica TaxID=333673 RepID=A0A3M0ISI1_HIRRU|nr:hypothetical protein DUI87_34146 [Hirundo rustica rustica]
MPSSVMLPQNWDLAIIDIKVGFFQIPRQPDDVPCFAFLVPTINREAPRKRYHWKFLPQGARNSLIIHQQYLSSLLSPVRAAAGEAIILHYMDDVLVCAPNDDLLSHALDLTIDSLVAAGFKLQEEKIQRMPPWKYLGLEIGLTGYPLAKRFSLASPSVLLPSKPLPPIRPSSPSSKPSKICSGEKEHGKNGSGYEDGSRKKQLISEGKECKASLLYCRGGDMKKGSLGPPLIPPIGKAVSPHVGSAAGSLQSPPQLDFQDSRDMRPRSSSRSKEEDSEHTGLTGYPLAKRFSLASPSVLLPSKPLPPIRPSSPSSKQSKICSGEKEHGENGSGYGEDSRNNQDLISEGRGCKASLLYCRGGDMKKGSLGPPLIPPIGKAVSPHVGSAAGSLQSPPQLDFQDSRDMRPRSSSRSKEEDSEHAASSGSTTNTQRKKGKSSWCRIGPGMPLFPRKLADLFGLKTYEQNPVLGNGGLGSRPAEGPLAQEPRQRQLSSAVPRVDAEEDKVKAEHGSASPRGLPWSQAKEMGHSTSPGPTRYEELRDGFEKLHAVLYWLARENLDQKDVERWVEEIKERRQKNMFLQLPPQTADPGDAAEASFSLPPVNGTASGVQRKHPRSALKKKVLRKEDNVPLHSKTPIIHGDGSFPRKLPSVTSQTATGAERPEEPLRGHGQKGTASSDPQQSLLQALSLLSSDDW